MIGVIYAMGRAVNEGVSFLVFTLLDLLDMFLCGMYKLADFIIEAEWKPCYCSSSSSSTSFSARKAITTMISSTRDNKILVSEKGNINYGGTKIVRFISSSSSNKILQLEDVSDTLYTRPSLVSEISKTGSKVNELIMRRVQFSRSFLSSSSSSTSSNSSSSHQTRSLKKMGASRGGGGRGERKNSTTAFTTTTSLNSTIVEMLQGKINGGSQLVQSSMPCIPRWSDCDCKTCTCWTSSSSSSNSASMMPSLFVHLDGAANSTSFSGDKGTDDVLFIHGFISSSKFWTETVFPNLSEWAKSKYRLFAVDLLGFGRSPKPMDSLYTLREHVEMIERSVLEKHKVKSFHIVAHSLGCILAFALAVRHPSKIKSLTLIAPPYFPVPKGEQGTQYVLRRVAPRRVWPPIAFGASIACWYEHISRTICLLICKNHRVWEFLFKLVTRNRMKTYLMEGFFCHTHNAAWHTLHNIICGTAGKLDKYLDVIQERLTCHVTIFHGRDDEVIPEECSYNVKSKIPRAQVKVVDNKDHITIVVGRQRAFARELEAIWNSSSSSSTTA